MKILLLSQYYFPEERTAPLNLYNMSIDLIKMGHTVMVLTGIPNHPYGKYYQGYKLKLLQKEIVEGVEIFRVPIYPDHSMSILKRMIGYFSFSLSALFIGSFILRDKKVDIIFSYLPPLTVGIPARILSITKKAPIVYWMTDLWPENLLATGKKLGRFSIYLIRLVENWVYSTGKRVTVNSEGFIPNLINKKVEMNKLDVISDYADPKIFYPMKYNDDLAMKYKLKNKFIIMYAGNIGKVQGIHHLINAAGKFQKNSNIHLVLIGDGTELNILKKLVSEKQITNVSFISKKPMNKISQYLALADVLILHLIENEVFKMQMPSKLIAYMAVQKPILCAFEGTAAKIVKNTNSGITCKSSDEDEIFFQMKKMLEMDRSILDEMGRNARSTYLEKFTREIQNTNVEKILYDAINGGR